MDHWQRLFAYITGSVVVGLMLILFTHSLLHYVSTEGITGYIALIAYGFVYLNLGYGVNRRFVLKADRSTAVNYIFSALMLAPTLSWIFTKDEGLGSSLLLFVITIVFAVFLGTYFGIRAGNTRREPYLKKMYENQHETPEKLKRPHDDLNKN